MGLRAYRRRGLRTIAAGFAAAMVLAVSGQAFAGSTPPGTAPGGGSSTTTSTTTLPPIPKVPPAITDGQTPQALLANAIELSSVGIDTSALSEAIAITQSKLDADASLAAKAGQA